MLDEWLLNKPDDLFRVMPLGLMELRYGSSSTIFRMQYRSKDWRARHGGGVHAEVIMDSIAPAPSSWKLGTSICATYTADGTERTPAVPIHDTAGTVPQYSRYGNCLLYTSDAADE